MANTNKKFIILLVAGILVLALSKIIEHYYALTDLQNGIFMGIGFGLVAVSFLIRNKKKASEN